MELDLYLSGGESGAQYRSWSEGDLIKNPATQKFCTYSEVNDDFVGTLRTLDFKQMYMLYTSADNSMHIFGNKLKEALDGKIVQIGANATIGYGYCEFKFI